MLKIKTNPRRYSQILSLLYFYEVEIILTYRKNSLILVSSVSDCIRKHLGDALTITEHKEITQESLI